MNELIGSLVSQLGIQEDQARGGAGLLFKLARDKLGGDFSGIASALPGVESLIDSAPQALGGMAKLAGGVLGKLGGGKAEGLAGLASLAGGFSSLKLDGGMIAKFVPVVVAFARKQGGQGVADLLSKALA